MAEQILADLQRRLHRLEDKDAITTLMNRYCKLADNHKWAEYSSCFLEDGVVKFDDWEDVVGRDKISTLISSAENRFQGQQHSLTNMELEIDGDQATGTCYLWFAATPDTSNPHQYHGFGGPYELSFKRTEAGWKIARLRLRKVWAQNPDTKGVFGG
jgi:3-phenylpropionate/cinnamic acid dioxygenase small subunit